MEPCNYHIQHRQKFDPPPPPPTLSPPLPEVDTILTGKQSFIARFFSKSSNTPYMSDICSALAVEILI